MFTASAGQDEPEKPEKQFRLPRQSKKLIFAELKD
jgi:hypothetical protein